MYKLIISFLILFLSQSSFAENVKIKAKAHNGEIITHGFKLDLMQGELLCRFYSEKLGVQKVRRRYMQMLSKENSPGHYSFKVKKISLTEWLPTFEIKNCAYKFIILGKNEKDRTFLGDVVLAGQEHVDMSIEDIRQMEDRQWLHQRISSEISPLELIIGKNVKGNLAIIKK